MALEERSFWQCKADKRGLLISIQDYQRLPILLRKRKINNHKKRWVQCGQCMRTHKRSSFGCGYTLQKDKIAEEWLKKEVHEKIPNETALERCVQLEESIQKGNQQIQESFMEASKGRDEDAPMQRNHISDDQLQQYIDFLDMATREMCNTAAQRESIVATSVKLVEEHKLRRNIELLMANQAESAGEAMQRIGETMSRQIADNITGHYQAVVSALEKTARALQGNLTLQLLQQGIISASQCETITNNLALI